MSLLDRSITFATSARDLDGLRKSADLTNAVGTRAQMFESAMASLRLASGQLALLRDHGVPVEVEVTSAAGFAHHLTLLKEAIAADPAAITVGDVQLRTLTPLRTFIANLSTACASGWRAHVINSLPRVGADLVPVLAQVPALKAKVDRFRILQTAARGKADSLPLSTVDFEALTKAVEACREAWEALDAEGIPPDVTRFLRAATSDAGAGLNLLTAEVSNWLEAQRLSASFTVRAR